MSWSLPLARSLSILGHPALLLPLVASLAAHVRGAPTRLTLAAGAAGCAVAAAVAFFSWWKTRSGRWQHVDASQPEERGQLNRFLLPLLLALAAAVAMASGPLQVWGGLLACAFIVLLGWLGSRWCKLSLHCAFATFATCLWGLWWPGLLATGALALGVAWSRLVLQRHRPLEVGLGLAAGVIAGLGFNLALAL